MVSTDTRKSQIQFHNQDLYDSIKIPIREYLLELTNDLELAVLLNQIIFSKKEKMTLNDIKKLSLNEKTKQTIRVKLEKLIELGLIRKYKNNSVVFNQDLYEPTEKIISDNQDILALVEGSDLKYDFNYLVAIVLNKFRTYAISGITEIRMSARQLKSMLGVNNSESSVRDVLRQLVRDKFLKGEIIDGTYNYELNVPRLTNNYSMVDIDKFVEELTKIYKMYIKFYECYIKEYYHPSYMNVLLTSFPNQMKRMLLDGYNPFILKHILLYLLFHPGGCYNDNFKTIKNIKDEYSQLINLSKSLSKRKAKRLLYKLQNDMLEERQKEEENKKKNNQLYWEEAYKVIEEIRPTLMGWYFQNLLGVNNVEFDDYVQEALAIAYKEIRKCNNNYQKNFLLNYIKLRLKAFMHNQKILKYVDGKSMIAEIVDSEFDNINTEIYKAYQEENEYRSNEIDFENNPGIKKLLSVLDERSKYIIKHYVGYDGHSLTFKEIGNRLNLSTSNTGYIYRKAILLLKEKFPPDRELEIRKLVNG